MNEKENKTVLQGSNKPQPHLSMVITKVEAFRGCLESTVNNCRREPLRGSKIDLNCKNMHNSTKYKEKNVDTTQN